MRRTLEDVLLEAGLIGEMQLRHVRRYARHNGVCLARAAVEHGGIDDEQLAATLAAVLRLPRVDLPHETVDDDAVREVSYDLAETRRLLPLSIERSGERRVMRVAMADPLDFDATEELEMSTGCSVEPLIGRVGELGDAVTRYYRGVITKMIPRRPAFGAPTPVTQPQHRLANEAPPELGLRALVELLADRGVLDRDAWVEAVQRLMKERAGE